MPDRLTTAKRTLDSAAGVARTCAGGSGDGGAGDVALALAFGWPAAVQARLPSARSCRNFGFYNTERRIVTGDTEQRYFFELEMAPNVMWAYLTRFDLPPGQRSCG
jgi:hypothetical protein